MSLRLVIAASAVIALLGSCSATGTSATSSANIVAGPTDDESATTLPTTTTTTVPPAPSTIFPSTTETPSSSGEIATFIEQLAAEGGFSGAALIGHEDEVVWQYASGPADREQNLSNQVDTKFNLGSMNKMFTAVAVLQLMERGELALDDTVADLFPRYPNPDVAAQVTVHQLLTHTSGLGDTFTPVFGEDPNRYRSNADYLPLFVDAPLLFDPGESFSYSNAGYVVLGLIIEELSGRDYYDYVRDQIFLPAGMADTDSYALDECVANLAMGYTSRDIDGNDTGVLTANAPLMPGRGFAAGGGYSTTEDMFRFRNALLGHELLTAESTNMLFDAQAEVAPGFEYGYGFMIREEEGSIGHSGGAPGICSFFSMYPDSGYTLIVLSNSDEDCLAVLRHVQENPLG